MDDDVVAHQADACTTFDLAFGDAATRDLADLRDVEHLEDLGVAEEGLATLRREQTRHRRLHVIHEVVDDVVVADFDALRVRPDVRACAFARTLKPMIAAFDASASEISDSVMPPAARVNDAGADFVGAELVERTGNGFDRTLHVALDDQREFLHAGGLQLRHHLFQRAALTGQAGGSLVAGETLAVFRDLAGAAFVFDDGELVTGLPACRKGREPRPAWPDGLP